MTFHTGIPVTNQPSALADRIGRGLLALCALATLVAFANGIAILFDVEPDRVMSEAWRTLGYLVFVGLFTMIIVAPRNQRGPWELIFLHKIAITVFGVVAATSNTPDAAKTWPIDAGLVIATAIAYVLCRGWQGWRPSSASARSTS
ncbi:hypothetical protein [Kribbella sp. CA-293567]|uniref:hypothetical protein n=1 Tax=Kribbella sp. CA-293567 TaxID=3002436 RepID=UPI0022DE47D9|nr:hypothetical protein [Kribbella sp. CA-293567]WBQ04391.1 hypothetical protein OX958_31060 [Kribbella sp. CA-293567]